MTNVTLLMETIDQQGLSLHQVADVLGLTDKGLSDKLRHNRAWTYNQIYSFGRYAGLSALELEQIFFTV